MKKKSAIQWILVTGLSGAGKSSALKNLEDMGYFTIDNLPVAVVPSLVAEFKRGKKGLSKVALGMDVREKSFSTSYPLVLSALRDAGLKPKILFLESREDVLVRRFSESRRPHPLGRSHALPQAIRTEKKRLKPLRAKADWVVDTSELNVHALKKSLQDKLLPGKRAAPLKVRLISFGYKFGLPAEADLVWDMRFLKNPYFVPALKSLDGTSASVQKFVLRQADARRFVRTVTGLVKFLLPLYQKEGKSSLTIAFGCTGGRHRSVALVEEFGRAWKRNIPNLSKLHRDRERSD